MNDLTKFRLTMNWGMTLASFLLLSALVLTGVSFSAEQQYDEYVQGLMIVNFKQSLNLPALSMTAAAGGVVQTGIATVDALNAQFQVNKIEKLFPGEDSPPPAGSYYRDLSGYYVLYFPEELNLDQVEAAYRLDPNIKTAEKDVLVPVDTTIPNDPGFSNQWALKYLFDYDLDMELAWDYERGDSAILLGIVDTGILRSHLDLGGTLASDFTNGNVWINWPEYNGTTGMDDDGNSKIDDKWGWDFVTAGAVWPGEDGTTEDNEPSDHNGHGTHVSGIAAGMLNNSNGISGVSGGWYPGQRGCKVMALRVGYTATDGRGLIVSNKVGPAINYARDKGVTALNFSFGFATITSNVDAVANALLDGIIVVHSAGNDNDSAFSVIDTLHVTGTTNRVISVASTDHGGAKSDFSTFGSWVSVSAPGSNIYSTYSNAYVAEYETLSGTSMSAPHVVGLAGLMKSSFPDASGEDIYDWILNTTKDIYPVNPGYPGQLGTGLINANNFFSNVPTAKFGYSAPTSGHAPFTVSFYDSSKGPVDSLYWDFGDGGFSTATNPMHAYTDAGIYTVRQHAWSDSFGTIYGVASVERKDKLIKVIADSIYFNESHGGVGETKVPLRILYHNEFPFTDLKVPISFAGADMDCDSVSFNQSRVAGFIIKSASIDNTNKTILIDVSHFSPLGPGSGLLATAYFTVDNSAAVGDTAEVDSAIIGGDSLYVVSTDPEFGTFDPKFVDSFIAVEPWPRGDVNKSGGLDLADVIYTVNYLLKSGPSPNPLWLADFNGDGVVTLADVIQMVNRLFKGI
ncbi:MAG: S8 family serine peptidase [candidate division Zixibacteria bacterium]|nr:S8 family serine peptidase [candidate division Zixibacteria bacterium]